MKTTSERKKRDAKPSAAKPRIVVVDDEPDFLDLMRLWLGDRYAVECFRSGVGLRDQLAALEPDLIILDVHMPEKDGFSVCRELRADQRFALLPVLFITASKEDVDFMRTLDAGANSYVNKPISGKELLFRVREMLNA
jgi:DNA-binding response OmpR family regulator